MNKFLFIIVMSLCINTIAAADGSFWTIVKSNRGDSFRSGPSGIYIKLGKVKPGTRVVPLKRAGDFYHVKFPNGQTGWIYFTLLKETRLMEITSPTSLYGSKHAKKTSHTFAKGDKVTRVGLSKNGAWYDVITKDGKKGKVSRHLARPVVERNIAKYDTRNEDYFRKDKFEDLVLGINKADLSDEIGTPGALIYKSNTKETWYYDNIILVSEGKRYRNISIQIEQNNVTAVNLVGEGRSYWVERLPLAYTIRGMSFLNVNDPGGDLFGFTRNWHWFFKIFVWLLRIGLAVLIFSIASIIAFKLSGFFHKMESLSNGMVKVAGYLVIFIFNYIYFLWLCLHVLKSQDWFTAIVMVAILIATFKWLNYKTNYYRCPSCHTMWEVEDKGTAVVGKTHITTPKSRDVYSHSSTSGNVKTNYYTTEKWNEYSTQKDIEDYRKCTVCEHEWAVERTETVDGHG